MAKGAKEHHLPQDYIDLYIKIVPGVDDPDASGEKARRVSDLTLDIDPDRGREGKLLSPARRRAYIEHVREHLQVSERCVCAALGQHRSTPRLRPLSHPHLWLFL